MNQAASKILFGNEEAVVVTETAEGSGQALFRGMRLTITENICKARGIVNGVSCRLLGVQQHCLHVETEEDSEVLVVWQTNDDDNEVFYPVTRGYGAVVHTVQGQTLGKIGVVFDRSSHIERGIAYTMLSRVRAGRDITVIGKIDERALNA